MALTYTNRTGDGVTTVFSFSFAGVGKGYIRSSDIHVTIDGVEELGFILDSESTVEFTTAPSEGALIQIRRIMPVDTPYSTFRRGNNFGQDNMNYSFQQELYLVQEILDGFLPVDYIAKGNLNMGGFIVENSTMRETPLGTDLATVDYVREISGSDAEYWANEAEAYALLAEVYSDNTELLYNSFYESYRGSGPNFPNTDLVEGLLFYYDGTSFTQGLYIYYSSSSDPYTGPWELVSGVGPQGPTGPEGIQGPSGVKGDQGLQGPQGNQGQQGIQGAIGDTGPAGIKGETGSQGVQGVQGIEGPEGPEGPEGVQGVQGPVGLTGAQGPVGPQGNDGTSFEIDAMGTLAERDAYDAELTGFTYYATDYSVGGNEDPNYDRFLSDGVTTDYTLTYVPDGPQSLEVLVAGVTQDPDMYTTVVTTEPESYTISLNEAPVDGTSIVIREFSLSTGYGAIYYKESDSGGDWSEPIPFGKGPRGDQGPQGIEGVQGLAGEQGEVGPQGSQGPQGIQGLVGPQGSQGDVGPQGQQGPTGDRGPDGIQGEEGSQGTQGVQGPQGNLGATGPQGAQGPSGDKGERGDQGATGPTGSKGTDGTDGSDGADGRSSSGKLYSQLPYQANFNDTWSTWQQIQIVGTQAFPRTLMVSEVVGSIKKTGTLESSQSAEIQLRLIRLDGASTASYSNEIQVYGSTIGDIVDKVTEVFSPLFIHIPANISGLYAIQVRGSSLNISESAFYELEVRGHGDSSTANQYTLLAQMIPESTELS